MKAFALLAATTVLGAASVASAGVSFNGAFNWDDGGTVMGSYGSNVTFANIVDPFGDSGSDRALKITEDPLSGTPQGYVAWIDGLNDGDVINVSMMGLGDGVLTGKIRLWAHYTTSDITSYGGSAGGSNSYSASATEWTMLSNEWTFSGGTASGGDHTGLVIEARLYAYSDNEDSSGWVDDITVDVFTTSSDVEISFASVPAPGALALLGLAGIAGRRRRRN
tara:strand:+ start:9499 stop:10164 length:666 start_codon:yes stop_codon:yes gene_type:complete